MNVGILSSWRTQCGLAEYTSHLARALERIGHGTLVLGSRNYDERSLPKEDFPEPIGELTVFDIEAWNRHGKHGLDVERILDLGLDVIHVQYEVILFHRQRLQELLDGFAGIKAITYHDSCIPPDMPGPWDLQFRHREDTGPAGFVIPMGIEDTPPVVKTFGLGRSRADLICSICDRNGWRFEQSFGDQRWLSQAELHAWLRDADAIVLWYPDVDSAGSSLAARTALATRRPLYVNDVSWFRDLPARAQRFWKLEDTPEALEKGLLRGLPSSYISENSWNRVAQLHLDAYTRCLVA